MYNISNGLETYIDQINKVLSSIRGMGDDEAIVILTHIDADGLSTAAIMAQLLIQLDKPFIIKPLNQLRGDILEEINNKSEPRELIILDMGSSEINMILSKLTKVEKLIMIDHHIPKIRKISSKVNFVIFNPWFFGYDGTVDISSSGLAYLIVKPFIKHLPKLTNTVKNAVVGAVGDGQDIGEKNSLIGINKLIVEDGVRYKKIEEKVDLLIYRRESLPIYKAIANMYSLEIPGITGSEEAAVNFLKQIGIIKTDKDIEKKIKDLNDEEKSRLIDELLSRLVFAYSDKFTAEQIRDKLLGYTYILIDEVDGPLRDAREFAGLLNACGKLGHPELGLSVAIGDRGKLYKKAIELFESYQKILSKIYKKAWDEVVMGRNLILLDARDWLDENLTSTVSSMFSFSNKIKIDGVVVVIGKSTNNYAKISFRLTKKMREKVNLAELVKKLTSGIEGASGGGHSVAAGAYVPYNELEKFINKIKENVEKI